MDKNTAQNLVDTYKHWHHKFEVFPGVVTQGSYEPGFMLNKLNLDQQLTGVKILDVGPSDGYFSLQLARRGAEVTAIDYRRKEDHGFSAMEKITGVKVRYEQCNLYDLTPEKFGLFDVVLFLGVLYHLPDMVKALNILRSVCTRTMFLETEAEHNLSPGVPAARYYEADTLAGDYTNFWAPNGACVEAMCRDAGFKPVRSEAWGRRYLLEAATVEPSLKHKWAYGKL